MGGDAGSASLERLSCSFSGRFFDRKKPTAGRGTGDEVRNRSRTILVCMHAARLASPGLLGMAVNDSYGRECSGVCAVAQAVKSRCIYNAFDSAIAHLLRAGGHESADAFIRRGTDTGEAVRSAMWELRYLSTRRLITVAQVDDRTDDTQPVAARQESVLEGT